VFFVFLLQACVRVVCLARYVFCAMPCVTVSPTNLRDVARTNAYDSCRQLRSSPDIHVDAQTVIVEFTNELLSETPGLFENLCKLLVVRRARAWVWRVN
jgi:hypothetical protein